jgi:putative transposase
VGIREVEEKIWLVSFLDFHLGFFDEKEGQVEPGPNPFEAKVLTMPPGIACKRCARNGH